MQITIGADELILWLRKNHKADEETTKNLGKKILKLIESNQGILTQHDVSCFWDTIPNLESVEEYKLPKTASQYIVDSSKLGDIYIALSQW